MQAIGERVDVLEARADQLESIFGQFMAQTGAALIRIDRSIERIEATIERMERESARDRREWNRRWGELANRLGTIVEDVVAPNLPRIARDYFGFEIIEDFMLRRTVLNKRDPSREREFDAILVGKTAAGEGRVIINETKSTARTGYADDVRRRQAARQDTP